MFPLSAVLFPGSLIPLHIFEPRYRALTRDCLAGDGRFGIVLIERGSEVGGGDQRSSVGTQVVITKSTEMADGRWLMLVEGERPIRIAEWLPDDPYPMARVSDFTSSGMTLDPQLVPLAEQCVRRTRGLLSESGAAAAMSASVVLSDDPEVACWQLCAESPLSAYDAQRLLSTQEVTERLHLLLSLTEGIEEDLRRLLAGG
jgi:Lon protease-like protein